MVDALSNAGNQPLGHHQPLGTSTLGVLNLAYFFPMGLPDIEPSDEDSNLSPEPIISQEVASTEVVQAFHHDSDSKIESSSENSNLSPELPIISREIISPETIQSFHHDSDSKIEPSSESSNLSPESPIISREIISPETIQSFHHDSDSKIEPSSENSNLSSGQPIIVQEVASTEVAQTFHHDSDPKATKSGDLNASSTDTSVSTTQSVLLSSSDFSFSEIAESRKNHIQEKVADHISLSQDDDSTVRHDSLPNCLPQGSIDQIDISELPAPKNKAIQQAHSPNFSAVSNSARASAVPEIPNLEASKPITEESSSIHESPPEITDKDITHYPNTELPNIQSQSTTNKSFHSSLDNGNPPSILGAEQPALSSNDLLPIIIDFSTPPTPLQRQTISNPNNLVDSLSATDQNNPEQSRDVEPAAAGFTSDEVTIGIDELPQPPNLSHPANTIFLPTDADDDQSFQPSFNAESEPLNEEKLKHKPTLDSQLIVNVGVAESEKIPASASEISTSLQRSSQPASDAEVNLNASPLSDFSVSQNLQRTIVENDAQDRGNEIDFPSIKTALTTATNSVVESISRKDVENLEHSPVISDSASNSKDISTSAQSSGLTPSLQKTSFLKDELSANDLSPESESAIEKTKLNLPRVNSSLALNQSSLSVSGLFGKEIISPWVSFSQSSNSLIQASFAREDDFSSYNPSQTHEDYSSLNQSSGLDSKAVDDGPHVAPLNDLSNFSLIKNPNFEDVSSLALTIDFPSPNLAIQSKSLEVDAPSIGFPEGSNLAQESAQPQRDFLDEGIYSNRNRSESITAVPQEDSVSNSSYSSNSENIKVSSGATENILSRHDDLPVLVDFSTSPEPLQRQGISDSSDLRHQDYLNHSTESSGLENLPSAKSEIPNSTANDLTSNPLESSKEEILKTASPDLLDAGLSMSEPSMVLQSKSVDDLDVSSRLESDYSEIEEGTEKPVVTSSHLDIREGPEWKSDGQSASTGFEIVEGENKAFLDEEPEENNPVNSAFSDSLPLPNLQKKTSDDAKFLSEPFSNPSFVRAEEKLILDAQTDTQNYSISQELNDAPPITSNESNAVLPNDAAINTPILQRTAEEDIAKKQGNSVSHSTSKLDLTSASEPLEDAAEIETDASDMAAVTESNQRYDGISLIDQISRSIEEDSDLDGGDRGQNASSLKQIQRSHQNHSDPLSESELNLGSHFSNDVNLTQDVTNSEENTPDVIPSSVFEIKSFLPNILSRFSLDADEAETSVFFPGIQGLDHPPLENPLTRSIPTHQNLLSAEALFQPKIISSEHSSKHIQKVSDYSLTIQENLPYSSYLLEDTFDKVDSDSAGETDSMPQTNSQILDTNHQVSIQPFSDYYDTGKVPESLIHRNLAIDVGHLTMGETHASWALDSQTFSDINFPEIADFSQSTASEDISTAKILDPETLSSNQELSNPIHRKVDPREFNDASLGPELTDSVFDFNTLSNTQHPLDGHVLNKSQDLVENPKSDKSASARTVTTGNDAGLSEVKAFVGQGETVLESVQRDIDSYTSSPFISEEMLVIQDHRSEEIERRMDDDSGDHDTESGSGNRMTPSVNQVLPKAIQKHDDKTVNFSANLSPLFDIDPVNLSLSTQTGALANKIAQRMSEDDNSVEAKKLSTPAKDALNSQEELYSGYELRLNIDLGPGQPSMLSLPEQIQSLPLQRSSMDFRVSQPSEWPADNNPIGTDAPNQIPEAPFNPTLELQPSTEKQQRSKSLDLTVTPVTNVKNVETNIQPSSDWRDIDQSIDPLVPSRSSMDEVNRSPGKPAIDSDLKPASTHDDLSLELRGEGVLNNPVLSSPSDIGVIQRSEFPETSEALDIPTEWRSLADLVASKDVPASSDLRTDDSIKIGDPRSRKSAALTTSSSTSLPPSTLVESSSISPSEVLSPVRRKLSVSPKRSVPQFRRQGGSEINQPINNDLTTPSLLIQATPDMPFTTITANSNDEKKQASQNRYALEQLAQEIYDRMRQRLIIEKERHGKLYSKRIR